MSTTLAKPHATDTPCFEPSEGVPSRITVARATIQGFMFLGLVCLGEATRETLATELEAVLDEADALRDALRRRDPPPRPVVDRRSVSAPVEAVASLEADLDALRRDVASLRPRQQASPPLWLFFAAVGLALTAWIMTPEDPYAAALAS